MSDNLPPLPPPQAHFGGDVWYADAVHAYARAYAAAAVAAAVPQWQPIETAPKDGQDIIVMYMHIETQVVHAAFWMSESDCEDTDEVGWWSYEYSEVSRIKLDDWMTPTHWMPLPSPPEVPR